MLLAHCRGEYVLLPGFVGLKSASAPNDLWHLHGTASAHIKTTLRRPESPTSSSSADVRLLQISRQRIFVKLWIVPRTRNGPSESCRAILHLLCSA